MASIGVKLSKRELEVMQLKAAGLADKQVARELGISYGVVRNYIDRAKFKYGAMSACHLVAILKNLKII